MFSRKGILKICGKFTGEHICQSNFIEITLRHGCSPVNFLHIFRTPFSKNTSGWLLPKVAPWFNLFINIWWLMLQIRHYTVLKMKLSFKVFFSKCDQTCSFLRIWPHLLKKFLMENFIFWPLLSTQSCCMHCSLWLCDLCPKFFTKPVKT